MLATPQGLAEEDRVVAFLFKIVGGFFTDSYEVPENVVLSEDTRLRDDLWLDDLGLEELSQFVESKVGVKLELNQVLACKTFGEVLRAIRMAMGTERPEKLFPLDRLAMPTVWLLEFRGQLKQNEEGLYDPGNGYSKDDKLFAHVRRTYRDVKRNFAFYWKNLAADKQRRVLLQSAPLPMSGRDEQYPVSLLLLPEVHLESMMGEGLLNLMEQRVEGDFRDICREDVERARRVLERFSVADGWDGKAMVLEGRQEVRIKSHKEEARVRDLLMSGQAIPGRVWGVYLAIACSLNGFFMGVLDDFKKKQSLLNKAGKQNNKRSICDACGQFEDKLNVCGRCKKRWYCSKDCQTNDWPSHKASCAKPAFALKFE